MKHDFGLELEFHKLELKFHKQCNLLNIFNHMLFIYFFFFKNAVQQILPTTNVILKES